eukprot:SM000034S12721  [mRNA]  locus=s34:388839:390330:+ [translate_table: standard]
MASWSMRSWVPRFPLAQPAVRAAAAEPAAPAVSQEAVRPVDAAAADGLEAASPREAFPLLDLPDHCMALVLSLTSPADVGRSACVCRALAAAAASDELWEAFIPRGYREKLLAEGFDPKLRGGAAFAVLTKGALTDGGKQLLALDPRSGLVRLTVSAAHNLGIVWGDTPRYWVMQPGVSGSAFETVAHLLAVCWFEMRGEATVLLPPGRYSVAWRLSRNKDTPMLFQNVVGLPVTHTMFSPFSKELDSEILVGGPDAIIGSISVTAHSVPQLPDWKDCPVGEFLVERPGKAMLYPDKALTPVVTQLALTELKDGSWKHDLYVDGVVFQQLPP